MDNDRPLTEGETEDLNRLLTQTREEALKVVQKYGMEAIPSLYDKELIYLVQFAGVMIYSAQAGESISPEDTSNLLWSLIRSAFNMGRASAIPKPRTEIVQ